jgi:paired amphipathic helix protein Sin3a
VLYSRLHLFKNIAVERVNDPSFNLRPNATAMDLELLEAGGSAEGQEQTHHVRVTASQYYELMLETCERLFDNQIEQLAFEDQMREMFGLHARRFFLSGPLSLCLTQSDHRMRTRSSQSTKSSPPWSNM